MLSLLEVLLSLPTARRMVLILGILARVVAMNLAARNLGRRSWGASLVALTAGCVGAVRCFRGELELHPLCLDRGVLGANDRAEWVWWVLPS